MKFTPTSLAGVFLVDIEPHTDERGFFARSFCEREFASHGLVGRFVQSNVAVNKRKGTIRGMHFQKEPKPEPKLVRCTRGSIFDVVVDIRSGSATFGRWESFELDDENRRAVYVPAGFAHGYQGLSDGSEVLYQMGEFYVPELASGFRWNDPRFKIRWPIPDPILSPKDTAWPDFLS